MADVRQEDVEEQAAALPANEEGDSVAVRSGELEELTEEGASGSVEMASLMGMPVQVTVEVGRIGLTLAELCQLGPGSLLRLDREAHQPADILVNGKVVARGEIVTIQDSYGVRIAEVLS